MLVVATTDFAPTSGIKVLQRSRARGKASGEREKWDSLPTTYLYLGHDAEVKLPPSLKTGGNQLGRLPVITQ